MTKYMNIGNRKTFKSGGSMCMTVPEMFVKQNDMKPGDVVEVLFNGTDLLFRAKKEGK